MATINTTALDAALAVIDNATTLHICDAEPANFAGVAGTSLGNDSISFTGPVNGDVSGRKVTVSAISGASVTGTGTASYWALVDGSTLYATGELDSPQGVVSGNTFSLAAFDIEIRDPV
jgi:hypothetical protein